MRCVAIIMVRNGIDYVEHCISHLIKNQIEVAILDQSSNDGTFEVCEKYLGNGVCYLQRIEYPGYFSLKMQLEEKYKLVDGINSDWIIHQDIDECLDSPYEGMNLHDSIVQEDRGGYSVVNFNEFVFLPYDSCKLFFESKYYYFFEPFFPRLMRAWKKSENLSALKSGGHNLESSTGTSLKISPNNYALRHYIFTSQNHAYVKYKARVFSETDIVEHGWHKNRLNIDQSKLKFPDRLLLKKMKSFDDIAFDLSDPWKKHFWDL